MMKLFLDRFIIYILFLVGGLILIYFNLLTSNQELQFEQLARSFLQGRLDLGANSGAWLDASYYMGHAYWPQGVFPAVLLTPFVFLFGGLVHQGHIQFILNLINLFILYKIALKITRNKTTSLWLSFSYIFSTAYLVIGLYSWSWWFAQVVATTVLLLALYEFLHRERWILIGAYVAFAMATRIDLILSGFFFVFSLLLSKREHYTNNNKLRNLFFFVLPIFITILLMFLYNFSRFGSVMEFGYSYHIPGLVTTRDILKQYGPWNLFYYPTNFYYLFLKGFDGVYLPGTKYIVYPFLKPDIWGASIFLTSPIFLWCVNAGLKEKTVKLAVITCILIMLFLFGYFGVGTRQYGYRYALDFSPFLFIILCYSFRTGMSNLAKIVIILSFALNFYLFPGIFTQALR